MEFTALFFAVTVTLVAVWRGPRIAALLIFAATFMASIAVYLHHATDKLQLSF